MQTCDVIAVYSLVMGFLYGFMATWAAVVFFGAVLRKQEGEP